MEKSGSYPVVAIVGRPNVGKSALFNRLAGRNIAIVHDRPGVTRDRLTAICKRGASPVEIMDTGGIGETIADEFAAQVQAEAQLGMDVADLILFVVDGYEGLHPVDQTLAHALRKSPKPLILVVNKVDSERRGAHAAEFSQLGFPVVAETSAAHGHGIGHLVSQMNRLLRLNERRNAKADESFTEEVQEDQNPPLRLAIVGRPNAGKSSLINAVIGAQRTIVSPVAGTTRDAVDIPFEINGKKYLMIDTAGMRRKARIHDEVETFSSMRAAHSIRRADLCLLVVDCADGAKMQDRKIAELIVENQKPCILVLNKFDLYHPSAKLGDRLEELMENMGREFFFMRYAPMIAVSATRKQFLEKIFSTVEQVREGAQETLGTGVLNRLLHEAEKRSPATLGASGKSFHLLYAAFLKDDEPQAIPVPHILLFANRAGKLQESYLRHLEHVIRETWPAEGLPMRFTVRGKEKRGQGKPADAPETKAPEDKETRRRANRKRNRKGEPFEGRERGRPAIKRGSPRPVEDTEPAPEYQQPRAEKPNGGKPKSRRHEPVKGTKRKRAKKMIRRDQSRWH